MLSQKNFQTKEIAYLTWQLRAPYSNVDDGDTD
jgi:hypothetical protein